MLYLVTMPRKARFLLGFMLLWLPPALAGEVIHHEISVTLEPAASRLRVTDRLTLPEGRLSWTFWLDRGLVPSIVNGAATVTRIAPDGHLARWRLERARPGPVELEYSGTIEHGLLEIREGMGRARQWSPGIIAADGVFLDGQSGWYPTPIGAATEEQLTFRLQVTVPQGWLAVSQGAGPEITATSQGVEISWQERHPQDEIHLIAAPFHRYQRSTPIAEAQVYLRSPDPALAERYLGATAEYLALYDGLIGPYPYAKFALVENFWETGYGMPSFTLLGPRVIRLPFIIHTSYPHEILHNWWGNGVFVDFRQGNWSEGLTTYLADHLLRERQGQGVAYRRDTLKAYMDYVDGAADFPIRDFRGRHNSAAQAIGYGKTMMVLHMLRRDLGDERFIAGLRRFYTDNRFRAARFDDLRAAFEAVSDRDLRPFFDAWIERPGAPVLAVDDIRIADIGGAPHLRGTLSQTQDAAPFPLTVPLLIHTAPDEVLERRVALTDRRIELDIPLPRRAIRLAVDPRFDLFRELVAGEAPTTLSALLGASEGLIVLPSEAPRDLAAAYRQLAEGWRRGQPGWQIRADETLSALPKGQPVWILGWENRFLADLQDEQAPFEVLGEARRVELPENQSVSGDEGVALTWMQAGQPIGWLAAGEASAIGALARKVPHYGRYSYLAFASADATNRLKGQWPSSETPLTIWLAEPEGPLSMPHPTPLVPQ